MLNPLRGRQLEAVGCLSPQYSPDKIGGFGGRKTAAFARFKTEMGCVAYKDGGEREAERIAGRWGER